MKRFSSIHLSLLLMAIAALIASIILYVYLYNDAFDLADHAVIARNAVADEGRRESQSKSILDLASTTAASRARLVSMFVPADDAVEFVQAMESVGPASGATVSISSLSETAADTSKKSNIGSLTSHIVVNGSWTNVMKAIELFELLPYKVKIDHMTLDTSIGSGDRAQAAVRSWQVTFDITASTII